MMRTITVKGVGNVSARPDYITVSMTIESMMRDYDKAMLDAAKRIEALKQAAVCCGYSKEDLKTTSFNVDTRYKNVKDYQGNYKRELAGYACVYHLKLSFDFDSRQLAKVVSAMADSGAKPELRIAFTVKNPAKVSEELLESAAQNARAKAEILCRASGCEMGQLLTIDYNWGELNIVSQTRCEMDDGRMMEECCAPEIEPDDIDLSDTVTFIWEIR